MEIRKGQKLTLSNNKNYLVMSKVLYNNIDYLYLISFEDTKDIKICSLDNNKLLVIDDKELIEKLKILFTKDVKDLIK